MSSIAYAYIILQYYINVLPTLIKFFATVIMLLHVLLSGVRGDEQAKLGGGGKERLDTQGS